jgi:hypothetical protein
MLKGAAAPTLHPVTALRFNGADAHNSRSDMAPGRSWSAKDR